MAVIAQRGRIVITPTAWKWYLGAGLLVVLALSSKALVVLVASAFLVLTGSGLVNRITLDEGGFEYRNYATRKRYRWSDVSDFGLRIYRVNYIFATRLITFSETARRDTLYGKFARVVAGGTQSVPVIGMDARKLLGLFRHYAGGAQATAPLPDAVPPVRPPAPKPATPSPAVRAASLPVQPPVDLVTSGRGRARQTKGWPYA